MISDLSKSCYSHIRQLRCIRPYLRSQNGQYYCNLHRSILRLTTLTHVTIIDLNRGLVENQVDYCVFISSRILLLVSSSDGRSEPINSLISFLLSYCCTGLELRNTLTIFYLRKSLFLFNSITWLVYQIVTLARCHYYHVCNFVWFVWFC